MAAVYTGKVRMALGFGAVMGQFKMPFSVLQVCFMNETGFDKGLKCAISRYLVRTASSEPCGYLLLC
jgi:hypothetical protein